MSEASTPLPAKYFLSLKEAANIIRVSESFMRGVLTGRRGPNKPRFVRMGRIYRIPATEFMQWVNQQNECWSPPKGKRRCT